VDTANAGIPSRSHLAAHAVTALYEAHALGLVRLAVVMTGDQGSAEDIVQDAWPAPPGHKARPRPRLKRHGRSST
jgi:hypothetical protein